MHLSVWLFFNDLFPKKRTLIDKLSKQNIFQNNQPNQVITQLKYAGFDGVELLLPKQFTIKDLNSLKNILLDNKFPVNSIHQSLRFFSRTTIEEIKKLCIIANDFSVTVIVLHLNTSGKQIFDQNYVDTIHKLETKYNIKIGFENSQKHILSFYKPHVWQKDKFVDILRQNNFHITFDTTHLGQTGEDIVKFFKKNKNQIVNIHLSDYKHHMFSSSLCPTKYTHMPLGKGDLPITELLGELKKNYKGLITLEINGNLNEICESASFVKKFINN